MAPLGQVPRANRPGKWVHQQWWRQLRHQHQRRQRGLQGADRRPLRLLRCLRLLRHGHRGLGQVLGGSWGSVRLRGSCKGGVAPAAGTGAFVEHVPTRIHTHPPTPTHKRCPASPASCVLLRKVSQSLGYAPMIAGSTGRAPVRHQHLLLPDLRVERGHGDGSHGGRRWLRAAGGCAGYLIGGLQAGFPSCILCALLLRLWRSPGTMTTEVVDGL